MVVSPSRSTTTGLSYEDWLRLPEDGGRQEIIDGTLVVTAAPATDHQWVAEELGYRLGRHLRERKLGKLFHAPVGVHLARDRIVEPDLAVILTEHLDRIGKAAIHGAPDLVVEVLSPATEQRDRGEKREMYADAAVAEYWIVDPEAGSVEVLQWVEGRYRVHAVFGPGDSLSSPLLPCLEIELAEILPPSTG